MNGDMLDTNVIIKYLAGDESAKLLIDTASDIMVPVVVVGELHYGAQKSSKKESNVELFTDFLSSFAIIPVDEFIAALYGEIKEQLRSKGINIPENDVWIAATAKSRQSRLLTYSVFRNVLLTGAPRPGRTLHKGTPDYGCSGCPSRLRFFQRTYNICLTDLANS